MLELTLAASLGGSWQAFMAWVGHADRRALEAVAAGAGRGEERRLGRLGWKFGTLW